MLSPRPFLPRLKKEASLEDVIDLCDLLLETGGLEEGGAVDVLMSPFAKKLTPMHYPYVDRWVDYFTNWAVTDAICLHVHRRAGGASSDAPPLRSILDGERQPLAPPCGLRLVGAGRSPQHHPYIKRLLAHRPSDA